jgi:hypothetical protein
MEAKGRIDEARLDECESDVERVVSSCWGEVEG